MSTLSMPAPTYPSTSALAPAPLASRPLSTLSCSSHRTYAPRKSSPLAEGISTSTHPSSLLLASPTATPPDSPRSLSLTNASTTSLAPSTIRPKPTHSKSLPTRVHSLRRPATAPFTSKSDPPPPHRRTQSTSSDPTEHSPRQPPAPEDPPVQFRPVKPSTSRAPEENWMTSESAPRFTRESLALGAVVLPVRKDDAQRLGRANSGAHVKYATMPNTAIGTGTTGTTPSLPVSTVNQSAPSTKTVTVVDKPSHHHVPNVWTVDADGVLQPVDGLSLDISKCDGTWKKNTAPFKHVRRLSKPKMKIRSGQLKAALTATQEKAPDLGLTEKLAVEKAKVKSDLYPRPSGVPSKRTKSIWAYITGFTRMTSS